MLRFAVCDDEPYMREMLEARIAGYMKDKGLACQIESFAGGRQLLEAQGGFDMVFLDIQMPEPDGMDTACRLRETGFEGLVVFITVLEECVFRSFEVQAFDYLLKPLKEEGFCRTMDRAVKSLRARDRKSMVLQKGNECRIIPFSQILYCEAIGRKIYLHRQGGEVLEFYERMDHVQQQVDRRFFRCHRSYLVNLEHICGYQGGQIRLSDGKEIPLSRLREQELSRALLLHMKEGC